jgi:hypothetical protein
MVFKSAIALQVSNEKSNGLQVGCVEIICKYHARNMVKSIPRPVDHDMLPNMDGPAPLRR